MINQIKFPVAMYIQAEPLGVAQSLDGIVKAVREDCDNQDLILDGCYWYSVINEGTISFRSSKIFDDAAEQPHLIVELQSVTLFE